MKQLTSLLIAEVFFLTSIFPAWAAPLPAPSHLRPTASDGSNRGDLIREIKTEAARDGGGLSVPSPQHRIELESYDALLDEVIAQIRLKRQKKKQGQFWVGITGASALGKGYLGDVLEKRLNAQGIHVVRLLEDMWVVDRLTRNEWEKRKDPRAYDHWRHWIRWEILQEALRIIRGTVEGEVSLKHLYNREDRGLTNLSRKIELTPNAVVLYDGLYLSDETLYSPSLFDILILLDASEAERIRRHKERDTKFGRSPEETQKLLDRMYEPQWKAHVAFTHPEEKADLVYDITSFDRPARLIYEERDKDREHWTVGRLDKLLRSVDQKAPWLREYGFDFEDSQTYFSLHIGAHVDHLQPRRAPIHIFHRVKPIADPLHHVGIKLYSISLRVPAEPPERLRELLNAIRQHPKILMVTVTQPHKTSIGKWVDEWDEAVYPIPAANYVVIKRNQEGKAVRIIGTNTDGPSWVEEYKERWGRRGNRKGILKGKNIVVLGGWGGIGQAMTLSILKERPKSLIISEIPDRVVDSKRKSKNLVEKLRRWEGKYRNVPDVTVVPAFRRNALGKDHPAFLLAIRQAHIVINATGIGMDEKNSPLRDPSIFRPGQEVFDAIYRTKEGKPLGLTPFLRQAKERGAKVFNGTGIIVRNRPLAAGWLIKHLTGQTLTPEATEEVYRIVYAYEQETGGLLEADAAQDGGRGRRIYFANLPGTENEPIREALRTLVGPFLNQGPIKGQNASTYLRALQAIETDLPRLSSEELLQVRLQLHAMAEGHDSRTSHSYYPNAVHFKMVDLIASIKRLEADSKAGDGGEKQDLLGILFETIETWRQMAPHRARDLRLQVLSGGMEVKIPRGTHISHLQYALSWLIENAIEFSNPGTEIRIFLIQQDQEAIIKIMDQGIGISGEWIPRVLGGKRDPRGFKQRPWRNIPDFGEFDPFAPGGLYAARRVIEEEYHGTLFLESEGEEKGTTVTVRIPLRGHSARDGGVKQLAPPSPRHLIPLYSP